MGRRKKSSEIMEEKTPVIIVAEDSEDGCEYGHTTKDSKNEDECGCKTEVSEDGCECRTKHRENKEYRDLINRLRRVEGQIRGVQKMVEEDRYCVDILIQVMAVQSALNSFNKVLLSNHIKSCVVEDIKNGNENAVDELCATIQKLMK